MPYTSNDTIYDTVWVGLSGLYTVNQVSSTSGNNFASFTELESALKKFGMCGPIDVYVTKGSGPYNPSSTVIFDSIHGLDSINTLYIHGQGEEISTNISGKKFQFKRLSYVTIDSLLIDPAGTLTFSIEMNNVSHFTLKDLNFDLPNASIAIKLEDDSSFSNSHHITIRDSYIKGAIYGISLSSSTQNSGSHLYIEDNEIVDCRYGITAENWVHGQIVRNKIYYSGSAVSSLTKYGILGTYNDFVISQNEISELNEAAIIRGIDAHQTDSSIYTLEISNNIIHNFYNYTSVCTPIRSLNGTFKILHNSIIQSRSDTNSNFIGITTGMPALGGSEIKNNLIFIKTSDLTVKGLLLPFVNNTSKISINHNIYYIDTAITSGNYVRSGSNSYGSLSLWQSSYSSSFDQNSLDLNPLISNYPNDFKPRNSSANNMGTPVGIGTDFYNKIRNSINPDIGAVEFDSVQTDAELVLLNAHPFDSCAIPNQELVVVVKNNGSSPIYNLPITFIASNGNNSDTVYYTHDTLKIAGIDTIFVDSISTVGGSNYYFTAVAKAIGDSIALNDSAFDFKTVVDSPSIANFSTIYFCENQSFQINLNSNPATTYFCFLF